MLRISEYALCHKNNILWVYQECEDFLLLGPIPQASIEMVEEDLLSSKQNNGRFCVVFLGEKIIGVVDYIAFGHEGCVENAYISLIMIAKNHRSKGVGSAVIREVEQILLSNQAIKRIYVSAQTNNERAIAFWKNHGYERVSEAAEQPDTTITYRFCKERVPLISKLPTPPQQRPTRDNYV